MSKVLVYILILISSMHARGLNSQMNDYMTLLQEEAKLQNRNFKSFDYQRGELIFTTQRIGKKGKLISCVSCHTNELSKKGQNIHTNKVIDPLSPIYNSSRFTNVKDVKKWLRRNFRDVYSREGTAIEKGDVITYIINKDLK